MMKIGLTIAVLSASPLAAQEFSLPQGCEGYLTIQSTSCSVSHYFTCEGDSNGEQRRATMDEEGLSYVGRISGEAEWLESFHLRSGHTERLSDVSEDPMSMSELELARVLKFVDAHKAHTHTLLLTPITTWSS